MQLFDDGSIKLKEEELDIKDEKVSKEYVEFGPENERLTVLRYREKVEAVIKDMVSSNFVLQKLQQGVELSAEEVEELANILQDKDPWVTEDLLRKVYDNKRAKFIQFINHILGLEDLKSFTQEVTEKFDAFIAEHNTYSQQQIQLIRTLRTFILRTGKIEKKDLVREPFTNVDPDGIQGVFMPNEIEEIIEFTRELVA